MKGLCDIEQLGLRVLSQPFRDVAFVLLRYGTRRLLGERLFGVASIAEYLIGRPGSMHRFVGACCGLSQGLIGDVSEIGRASCRERVCLLV